MNFFTHFSALSIENVITPFDQTMNSILIICMFFAIALLIFGKNKQVSQNQKVFNILIILIVLLEVSRQVWAILTNQYLFEEMLPFHLCGIQVFLMPLYIKTKNEKLFTFIYLTALPGALAALIFNDTVFYKYPLLHFQTIQTYLIHTLIMIVPIYGMLYLNLKPKLQHFKSSLIIIMDIILFNTIVNLITKGNYLFLNEAPKDTPIEWVATITGSPGYVPVMIGIVALIWLAMLIPFRETYKTHRKESIIHEN